MTGLQYTILHPWLRQGAVRTAFSGLTPQEVFLLTSPDSMTRLLEEIYGVDIEVRPRLRERREMDNQSAAYLQTACGGEALARGVWIKAHCRPLIYAFSLIPIDSVDKTLLDILEGRNLEPIGRTLNSSGIPFTKQTLEAGVILCPTVAHGLGLADKKPFFARRYILTGEKEGAMAIKAAITEVFSPELISTDHLST